MGRIDLRDMLKPYFKPITIRINPEVVPTTAREIQEVQYMEENTEKIVRNIQGWTDGVVAPATVPPAPTAAPAPLTQVEYEEYTEGSDPVEAPSHYCRGGYELGPILYVWGLTHRRASAVEYIMRAGDKDPEKEIEDLRKAIRNLEMELDYMERFGRN